MTYSNSYIKRKFEGVSTLRYLDKAFFVRGKALAGGSTRHSPAANPDIARGLLFFSLSLTINVFIRKSIIAFSISRQRKRARFRRIFLATGGYRHAADALSGLTPCRSQLKPRQPSR